jgi:hypothetical protein
MHAQAVAQIQGSHAEAELDEPAEPSAEMSNMVKSFLGLGQIISPYSLTTAGMCAFLLMRSIKPLQTASIIPHCKDAITCLDVLPHLAVQALDFCHGIHVRLAVTVSAKACMGFWEAARTEV